jgi:hypothetical protein
MFRSLRAVAHCAALIFPLSVAVLATPVSPAAAATCDRSATSSSTLASAVSAATAGQTICLASGSYGTFTGTSSAITRAAAAGATPTMQVNFGSGDSSFTLDGLSGMSGMINGGAKNITIRNSTFTNQIDIEGATSNIVLDHVRLDWNAVSTNGGPNSKIFLNTSGTLTAPAVTIQNSSITNGDLDGIHVGGGSGVQIVGNTFSNLCDRNVNHTDNIQFEGGTQVRIAGNYFYAAQNCPTQGITSYDSGTNGVIVEDNVVDIPRDWGIEFYADKNSIIRHNTVVYHPKSYSNFGTGTGFIDINRKSQDPAGSGTQVYDNITTGVSFANGSTGTQKNNVSGANVKYVGPTTTYAGFKLASDSPAGRNAASDGLDAGARIGTTSTPDPTPTPDPDPTPTPDPDPTPTPDPDPTPTPTPDTPANAVWTAPSGAVVGTAVTLDGTSSTGDGTLSCSWSFENQDGSIIWETQTGCKLSKTFTVADTKYVKLTVTDADGDTSSNKKSFAVAEPTVLPPPTETPGPVVTDPAPTPEPTPTEPTPTTPEPTPTEPTPTEPTPTEPTPTEPTPIPSPTSPVSSLVAAFTFEDTSSTYLRDDSGKGNYGTISGARRTTAGKHGRGLLFDGNDYVTIADDKTLDLTTGMTLEAWVKPSTTDRTTRNVMSKDGYALLANTTSGRAAGNVRTTTQYGATTTSALPANKWSHLAATYDGKTLRVYVNGAPVSSKSASGLIATGRSALKLGTSFKGTMDDVRVFNTALSASAVTLEAGGTTAVASSLRKASKRK